MKILILTNGYPDNYKSISRMFIHIRSKYYKKHGFDFDILNFQTKHKYVIDGVNVIPLSEYKKGNYEIAICHSGNLKHHYWFFLKHESDFKTMIFFFHGFEIMKLNKDYPKPYKYIKRNIIKEFIIDCYDQLKLALWHKYYKRVINKSYYVFVSNYIYDKFKQNVRINDIPDSRKHIINNGVGDAFVVNTYNIKTPKKYDFITIRSNLDGSAYCIDLICENARMNPDLTFLILGKGNYFKHNVIYKNVTFIEETFTHEKIISYLEQSRCALMLTRCDTQGVMSCEMVTYGIPLITSDISVCREIFAGCKNVRLIPNEACNLKDILINIECSYDNTKVTKWNASNTVNKEIKLIANFISC